MEGVLRRGKNVIPSAKPYPKMKTFVTTLVVCLGLFVTACGAKRSLVGKWEEIGGKEKMEFRDDGAVTVSSGSMSVSGKYSLPDETHIKLELDGLMALAGPQIHAFAIADGVLSLTGEKGKAAKYKKVP